MGHYLSEMQGMSDKEFQEKKDKDRKLGGNLYEQLLIEESLDIDLEEVAIGEWLTIKEKFWQDDAGEEKLMRPVYTYSAAGASLADRFSSVRLSRENLKNTPLVVQAVDKENRLVEVSPRFPKENKLIEISPRFHNDTGLTTYKLDANMLTPLRGNSMQTILVKEALFKDLLTLKSLQGLNSRKLLDILTEEGELTLKELEDKYNT